MARSNPKRDRYINSFSNDKMSYFMIVRRPSCDVRRPSLPFYLGYARGHIFVPILMKLGKNVCLNKMSDEFENGHVGSKSRSLDKMGGGGKGGNLCTL